MDYEVRHIRRDEWPLLENFLYEAIFIPGGFEGELPRSVIYDDPKCRAAFEGFGSLPDDKAVVAEADGRVVGACWVRTTDEYGHIDDQTPSLSISVYEQYRSHGIGTAMMRRMLDELREAGYTRASLSVQKANPALRLYERLGFRTIGDGADETEWLMVCPLGIDIRIAEHRDEDAVFDLVQETIRDVYPSCYSPSIVEAFCRLHCRQVIEADIEEGKVRVIEAGGKVVGTGTLDGPHITRVFVLPTEQGKGYGSKIMDELESVIASSNTAPVLDSSLPARKFYLHRDYAVVDIGTWDIEPCGNFPADKLEYEIMEKTLRN